MKIQLIENNQKPSHKDLYISIPELSIDTYADTYYFLLDNGILPDEETEQKVRIVLKYLLQEWIESVTKLDDGDIAFLPFDFSDQYVGALKVQCSHDKLIIRYAWNPKLGSMSPSRYNKFKMLDEEFNVLIGKAEVHREEFIFDIEQQIEQNS